MTVRPQVSVVIPAFNAARLIGDTLRSVQEQSLQEWEAIVIDDGSQDGTAETVRALARRDARIRAIQQANSGVSRARNRGLEAAAGEFIALLDADDVWLPENLARKVGALRNHEGCDWVYSDVLYADEQLDCRRPGPSGTDVAILDSILLWEREVVPGPCSNIVMRDRCIRDVRFDPAFSTAADQDFKLRLAARFAGKHIPEPLLVYRVQPGSLSRSVALMERDHIGVYRKAQSLGLFRSESFRRRCFANLYLILAGSWWVDGKDSRRGLAYILKAALCWPPVVLKLLPKLQRRLRGKRGAIPS
jgi:glycosyltransferase involved in cell wall biosynthesis